MTNPWYFMTALPFLFVLLVRGLEAINRRLATAAAAALAVLFVVIDLHGTWVDTPRAYASTTDAALQWSRLTSIHPAVLSGDLRWVFLAMQLGALCLVVGGLVYASRNARGPAEAAIAPERNERSDVARNIETGHIVEPANEQNLDRLLSVLTGG
jgi:predicted membrane channel-forming protein YqfA (hemolysin III family)